MLLERDCRGCFYRKKIRVADVEKRVTRKKERIQGILVVVKKSVVFWREKREEKRTYPF